eukprot:4573267-Karenia_brevis.AAC.1
MFGLFYGGFGPGGRQPLPTYNWWPVPYAPGRQSCSLNVISFSGALAEGDKGGQWERLLKLLPPLPVYVAAVSAKHWQHKAVLEAMPCMEMEA